MADQKISQLTGGGAAQATDEYVVARSGGNNKITGANVAAAATSVGTLSSLTVSGDLTVDTSTLKVDSANNRVGIKTVTPDADLNVNGYSGNGTLRIGGGTSGESVLYFADAGTGAGSYAGYLQYLHSSDALAIGVNAVEAIRISSAGNLGLGVTPSAADTGTYAKNIEIGQVGNTIRASGASNFEIASNAYFNSVWKYAVAANSAARYSQQDSAHRWYIAPTGTNAGDTITFTQAMTLDASGNLGIGKTPAANTRLDVVSPATNQQYVDTLRLETSDTGDRWPSIQFVGNRGGNAKYCKISCDGGSSANEGRLVYFTEAGHNWYTGNGTTGSGATERARITSGGYFKASNAGTYATTSGTGSYHEIRVDGEAASWTVVAGNTVATGANAYGIRMAYTAAAPNGTGNQFLQCADNAATRAEIRSNGGLANYQANNVDLSDARTKTDIAPLDSMWDKVAALEIVSYKYLDQTHDDVNLGVIAQQVETVEPVWVDNDGFGETPEGEEPMKTVYNKDIYFAAIKALQEAMARIEALEARLEALEA